MRADCKTVTMDPSGFVVQGGFVPLSCEWWHFSLKNEPYPDTYYEFPVLAEYLKR